MQCTRGQGCPTTIPPMPVCTSTLRKHHDTVLQLLRFAKDAAPGLAEQLQVDHTLVDGRDDLFDMYLYSLMHVYVQGVSSWSVMPTYVHSGRVVIMDRPEHPKFQSVYRDVNHIYHFQDLAYLNHIA